MMNTKRIFVGITACAVILFALFILYYQQYVQAKAQIQVRDHAQIVSNSLWTFEKSSPTAYLTLAAKSNNYERVVIKDDRESIFLKISGPPLKKLDAFLVSLNLIQRYQLQSDIAYAGKPIGSIEVIWRCKTIYTYLYILLCLTLMLAGIWLYLKLLDANRNLESKVRHRTAALEKENRERRQAEEGLRKYEHIVSSTPDLMSFISRDYVYQAANNAYLTAHGKQFNEIVGHTVKELHGADVFYKVIKKELDRCFAGEEIKYQAWFDYPGIGRKFMDVVYSPYLDSSEAVLGVVVNSRDITETKQLEARLAQSQKMESIGTLAGGIAHDFNNILSPVIGYAELLKMDLPNNSPSQKYIDEILAASHRAGNLVRQILTFSRQAEQEIKPLKIQIILKEVIKLIRASIPTTIDIRQTIDPDCGMVLADPTQIHQIAMNLVTNAYHAMEEKGGTLSLELKEIEIAEEDLHDLSLDAGSYICFSVSDTGPGMTEKILEKIFNPYFTTKANGKGTGLGLSVVHGIVKSMHGEITVKSRPGEGARFDIYLPKIQSLQEDEDTKITPLLKRGSETVLLVDDEEHVALSLELMLTRLGYRVEVRMSSLDALELFKIKPDAYDLIITDMTMPNMTGDVLAKEILKIRPQKPIIICTGFSERINPQKAKLTGIKGFLMKPVTVFELAETVRNILGQ